MPKQKTASAMAGNGWLQEIFQVGVYKRSQGRITRQVTCAAMIVAFALAAWRMQVTLDGTNFAAWLPQSLSQLESWLGFLEYGLPGALLVLGLWLSYRIVNMPRFADFLIAVEAEMNKVSWPGRPELIRSSMVVIFVIFSLAFLLFGYDIVWKFVFKTLNILKG